jgi:hypothetical protein
VDSRGASCATRAGSLRVLSARAPAPTTKRAWFQSCGGAWRARTASLTAARTSASGSSRWDCSAGSATALPSIANAAAAEARTGASVSARAAWSAGIASDAPSSPGSTPPAPGTSHRARSAAPAPRATPPGGSAAPGPPAGAASPPEGARGTRLNGAWTGDLHVMPGIDRVGLTAQTTSSLMRADLTGFTQMVRRTSFQVARGRLLRHLLDKRTIPPQREGMCAGPRRRTLSVVHEGRRPYVR